MLTSAHPGPGAGSLSTPRSIAPGGPGIRGSREVVGQVWALLFSLFLSASLVSYSFLTRATPLRPI